MKFRLNTFDARMHHLDRLEVNEVSYWHLIFSTLIEKDFDFYDLPAAYSDIATKKDAFAVHCVAFATLRSLDQSSQDKPRPATKLPEEAIPMNLSDRRMTRMMILDALKRQPLLWCGAIREEMVAWRSLLGDYCEMDRKLLLVEQLCRSYPGLLKTITVESLMEILTHTDVAQFAKRNFFDVGVS